MQIILRPEHFLKATGVWHTCPVCFALIPRKEIYLHVSEPMSKFSRFGVGVGDRHEAINVAVCQAKNIIWFGADRITIVKMGWDAISVGWSAHPGERQFTLPPGFRGRSLPVSVPSIPPLLLSLRALVG